MRHYLDMNKAPVILTALILMLLIVPAHAQTYSKNVLLLIDKSGSMDDYIQNERKIDIAKDAASDLVNGISGINMGLRVFPRSSCDSENIVPIAPIESNRPILLSEIDDIYPLGSTPIAEALTESVSDFPPTGERIIVLLSDGEETCGGDPVAVAYELAGKAYYVPIAQIPPSQASPQIPVVINTIGFNISDEGAEQLQQIAQATGGTYYGANDKASLSNALKQAVSGGNDWLMWIVLIVILVVAALVAILILKKKSGVPAPVPPVAAVQPAQQAQEAQQPAQAGAKFCSQCGKPVATDSAFCAACGAKV
jgi:Ca-activated chloride channel family protein